MGAQRSCPRCTERGLTGSVPPAPHRGGRGLGPAVLGGGGSRAELASAFAPASACSQPRLPLIGLSGRHGAGPEPARDGGEVKARHLNEA